jgi:hypothetical protein
MIELLFPNGFDTLEYSWVKATTGICTLADYSVAKKCQHVLWAEGSKLKENELGAWGAALTKGETRRQRKLQIRPTTRVSSSQNL